ncbi:MAG: tRNA threonylcarbamoyladenosine dehydratase [Lachnospiraceae bacterium]|nr:tRNA threonylcarbamoyladenosine dehydratase [Lachnospiraceae bacterium]
MQGDFFSRTRLLYGDEAMERLKNSHVAVFGLGGVGGYVAEALARAGIGSLTLVDSDSISISNLNRQILATCDTIGKDKVEVAAGRIISINPDCRIYARKVFFLPENSSSFDFSLYDYVVDAVDTVSAKLSIIEASKEAGTRVISCMGAGNKVHPELFRVSDIYDTKVCPLAKVMRRELRKRGIESLKVVYSEEEPLRPMEQLSENGRHLPGSSPFAPAAAGIILSSVVVNELAQI